MANIGIDFGTTNTLIVAYDKRTNEFSYYNYDGDKPVPTSSTVWYHDNTIVVGTEAKSQLHKYIDIEGHHFEKSIKLKLGTNYNAKIFGNSTAPYKVAGQILKHVKTTAIEVWKADKSGVDLKKGVFTVPINFSGEARRDLRKSAREAGIEVITFIHEPFAAIVGYYFSKKKRTIEEVMLELYSLDGQYILTFDWGGGTLDITVVQIQNGKMIELGTSELTGQAGDKFDEDIAWWAWNKFLNKYGSLYNHDSLEIIRKNKWGRMLAIAERCKIELTDKNSTHFLLESVIPGKLEEGIDELLTRKDFELLIRNTIDKATNKIDEAIREANINEVNISHVLLTGGSSNIFAVQSIIKEKFGHRVESVSNADLLIAQGAAVIAEFGWLPFLTKDILVQLSDNSFWAMFEKGMPIAVDNMASCTEVFTCVDQRNKHAKIIVCDGIGQKKDTTLAILNVPVLKDERFHDDIELNAILDNDIILKVSAHSKMAHGYKENENFSIQKTAEIYKMCFGLDIRG